MTDSNEDMVVTRSPDQVFSELEGQIVMMSVKNGAYYALDAVASGVWTRMETPIRLSALCEQLAEEYDVTPERARDDVLTFLRGLEAEGLVRLSDAG